MRLTNNPIVLTLTPFSAILFNYMSPEFTPGKSSEWNSTEWKIKANRDYIYEHYDVEVRVDEAILKDNTYLELEMVAPIEALFAIRIIRQEMTKYPREYVDYCGIKKIKIVRNLKYKDEKGLNLTYGDLDWDNRTIYISFGLLDYVAGSLPLTMHHELFHGGDKQQQELSSMLFSPPISGVFYHPNQFMEDWMKINPKGKGAYFRGNESKMTKFFALIRPGIGFINYFARASAFEDRAYVADLLMTKPLKAINYSVWDPVFLKKVEKIKEAYRHRSDGKMGEQYFDDLIAGKVKEGYWDLSNF